MIVVDASAVLELLLNRPAAASLADRLLDPAESLHAPDLLDVEVLHVLRRFNMSGELSDARAEEAIANHRALPIEHYSHELLVDGIWALRHNVTAYDAAYLALAQMLRCALVTADKRLARAALRARISATAV